MCKSIILNHLIWHSNRQDCLKRIVAQKLGTVYTLKDYYTSKYLIKDHTLKNLYHSNKFTIEDTAQIIEGKQLYQFQKPKQRRHHHHHKRMVKNPKPV